MLKNKNIMLAVTLMAALAGHCVAQEAKLIAVLKSGASLEEKMTACRQLARIGTKESVPVLASLLGDEKLSHMARYALEPIRDPSVDDALRDALGKLKGRPLQGVIGSLGVRHDTKAVEPLAGYLAGPEADIAQAAARALGNIGTAEAAKSLETVLAGTSGASQAAICEGLLRCAEVLDAHGNNLQSQAIYDRLRELASAPQPVRAAALRGAILARGKAGISLMIGAIRGPDRTLTAAAVRTAMELRIPEVTGALCGELSGLPVSKQVLVINTLGYRGDRTAGPTLLTLATKGQDAVRLAAVNNLTHLGYAQALPLLAQLSLSSEGELATAAQTCLANFPGRDADAAILAMVTHKEGKVRCLAIQMIEQRNVAGSMALVVKAAEDTDSTVRSAAFNALRHQAGAAELPALLKILLGARSKGDVEAAEAALLAVCARESKPASGNVVIVKAVYGNLPGGRSANVTRKVAAMVKSGTLAIEASNDNFGDPADGQVKKLRVDYKVNGAAASKTVAEGETLTIVGTSVSPIVTETICEAIPAARGEARLALLRTLRTAGGPKALAVIRAALTDNNRQVKDAAVRILCDWPSPDALPAIIELAKSPPSQSVKILALRGLVRLVPQQDAPDARKTATLKQAMALAARNEERQLVLSALGTVPTVDGLMLVASHLDNPVLKDEACTAAVTIAEKLAHADDAQVTEVMNRVAKTTSNKELAARAETVAQKGKK